MSELLLMTPGPTRVPERVLRAGGRPMIHHRTPEFAKELATVLELLPPIFGTTQPILPVHTTGRGALEATICNLFSPGDEIAGCCNGKFGEMWAGLAESYGVVAHRIETDWERSVNPAAVDAFLAEHPRVKAVAMTYADSSTGVANDVAAVAHVANERGVLTMVDGVSSIGGMPFAVRCVGRRRGRHGVAEVSDVEPRDGVRGNERTRVARLRDGPAPAQLLELFGHSVGDLQSQAGDAGHDAGASRAAGRRSAADDSRGRIRQRAHPPSRRWPSGRVRRRESWGCRCNVPPSRTVHRH